MVVLWSKKRKKMKKIEKKFKKSLDNGQKWLYNIIISFPYG